MHLGEFRLDMRENEFTESVIRYQNRLPRVTIGVTIGVTIPKNTWMWHMGTWLIWEMVGLDGPGGLFQGE